MLLIELPDCEAHLRRHLLDRTLVHLIEDFRAFLQAAPAWGMFSLMRDRREAWISALEAGRSPFDAATKEALRNE